jgi:hypothetical protein
MGRAAAPLQDDGMMSTEASHAWAEEIRDFLIGRLGKRARTIPLRNPRVHEIEVPPIRRWWIFEGKRYGLLGGPLATNFSGVLAAARRLNATFNPRLRLSDRLDGEVDWGHTLSRGAYGVGSSFVIRSSGIGLDESEVAALRGWLRWLQDEWRVYAAAFNIELSLDCGGLAADPDGPIPIDRLRRWAHTVRRSRWPLLRGVIAESLRPALESDELDCIPLPGQEATLFELLCVVRIARFFENRPRDLRWLMHDAAAGGNTLQVGGLSCLYQHALRRDDVLATSDYRGSLARAVEAFGVGTSKYVDIAFDFEQPKAGFDGIIVEAKSGAQQYADVVAQLRTYRAARRRRAGARYVVWGIVEGPVAADATEERIRALAAATSPDEDLWVFSSSGSIDVVLETLFGNTRV